MKFSRYINRKILRLLMVLALFAQWVVPASVYAAMPAAPVSDIQAVSSMHDMAGMSHHDMSPERDTCIVHCSQADQLSLDHAHLAAPPVGTAILHAVVPQPQGLLRGKSVPAEPHLAASPPLSILYCSLLN